MLGLTIFEKLVLAAVAFIVAINYGVVIGIITFAVIFPLWGIEKHLSTIVRRG